MTAIAASGYRSGYRTCHDVLPLVTSATYAPPAWCTLISAFLRPVSNKATSDVIQHEVCQYVLLCCRSLQQYPWLTAARGSSLQSGCAAILAIMKLLKIHHVLVSDRDLLHGLMMELLTSNAVGRNPTHGLMKSSLTGRSQV